MSRTALTILWLGKVCCLIPDDFEKKYGGAQIPPAALDDLNTMLGGFL